MRVVAVKFHRGGAAEELGRVELPDGAREARLVGFTGDLLMQLSHGVPDFAGDGRVGRITVLDGGRFLDAVLQEFSGGYVRAEEVTK